MPPLKDTQDLSAGHVKIEKLRSIAEESLIIFRAD